MKTTLNLQSLWEFYGGRSTYSPTLKAYLYRMARRYLCPIYVIGAGPFNPLP